MVKPVHIFIDGSELIGWTDMSLTRSKDKLTGSLELSIFMGYMPDSPCVVDAARGREITAYIGGHLAFIGYIDKRTGTGARHGEKEGTAESPTPEPTEGGGSQSLSIGPNEYTVKLSARGKTKYLIDSSHQHPTTNMVKKPTTKQVVEKLCEPWKDKVQIEWIGTDVKLDKVRFRDGCRVVDELHRVCSENCYFMYETRDGKLRVTDDIGPTTGEPIVLGVNILAFSSEQSEDKAKSKIKVKGQRTDKEIRGKDAVIETVKEIEDQWVESDIPLIVQHYGDATPEALERRGRFEANKRSAASKKVSLDVFHIQTPSGEPWDIGQLHYVEIPPEGIFDVFECTELTYTVTTDEIKTALTLSPPPAVATSGGSANPSSLPELPNEYVGIGGSRRSAAGITFTPGKYPAPWSGPKLFVLPFVALATAISKSFSTSLLSGLESSSNSPVLKLPEDYRSPGEDL